MIASGKHVILRDSVPSDVDNYVRWWTQDEWAKLDEPWVNTSNPISRRDVAKYRKSCLKSCASEKPSPRVCADIETVDGVPIGWVRCYSSKESRNEWYLEIAIGEETYWERGLGTEALRLWVDYLFANSDFHRLALFTYSLNPAGEGGGEGGVRARGNPARGERVGGRAP